MLKYKNTLLNAFIKNDVTSIFQHLTPVELKQRQVLYEIGEAMEYVYFMETGVASVINTMADGASIEVGMVGFEGVVGSSALLNNDVSGQHVVIQIAGKGYRLKVSHAKAAFDKDANFRRIILRFVDVFIQLSGQTAACNRLHSVEQRCARWLLMSSDRAQSKNLHLTQEYLAAMIGVRRSGVTEAAGELQRSGLISYNHGDITIVDRAGLEKSACECYRLDRERFKALITEKL